MSGATKTILFVDDELPLLQLFGELMRHRSGGAWEVLLAETAAKALAILKDRELDLLVVDARMPVMSGLQLVRLARPRHPHVPAVILTGYMEENRDAYLREGVDVILEKPRSPEGYETLYLTLAQLLEMQKPRGFRGLLDHVELQDVIQLECLRRNSSVLDVFSPAESGEIIIQNGLIVHAQAGDLTGVAAFNHLLTLQGGEFRIKPYREPQQVTIGANWEVLLMEAARVRDEVAGKAAEAQSAPDLPPKKTFPKVQLEDAEKRIINPAREFVSISTDGQVLIEIGASKERVGSLSKLVDEADYLPCSSILGRPELLEIVTNRTDMVAQFQADAVVVALRDRTQPS